MGLTTVQRDCAACDYYDDLFTRMNYSDVSYYGTCDIPSFYVRILSVADE